MNLKCLAVSSTHLTIAFLFFTDITNTISINNNNTTTTNLATKAKSDSFSTSAEGTLQRNHQTHNLLRTEFISTLIH